MAKKKHNYRDSLFVDLFGKCAQAKENFLSLYNAIHNTNLQLDEVTIEPVTLKNVVYTGVINDVSMKINDTIIVLAEQQSTINYNMPLRCLEYVTAQYSKMFKKEKKYAKKRIELPRPEFFVFYNGKDEFPKTKTLRLSDSFKSFEGLSDSVNLELKVKVFNINISENLSILKKCIALFAYSKFSEYVRIGDVQGENDPIGYALDRCIAENILADYFENLKREDRGMIFGEYSREDDIRVQCEEAFEDGLEQGVQRGAQVNARENARNLLKLGVNPETVSKGCSISLEQVLAIKKTLSTEAVLQ